MLYLGTLNKQLAICRVDSQGNVLIGETNCYNLIPVFDWIKHCIISIFLVFFIAFLPLFMQGACACHSVTSSSLISIYRAA